MSQKEREITETVSDSRCPSTCQPQGKSSSLSNTLLACVSSSSSEFLSSSVVSSDCGLTTTSRSCFVTEEVVERYLERARTVESVSRVATGRDMRTHLTEIEREREEVREVSVLVCVL